MEVPSEPMEDGADFDFIGDDRFDEETEASEDEIARSSAATHNAQEEEGWSSNSSAVGSFGDEVINVDDCESSQNDEGGDMSRLSVERPDEVEIKRENLDVEFPENEESQADFIRPSILKFEDFIQTRLDCPWCDMFLGSYDKLSSHARSAHRIAGPNVKMDTLKRRMCEVACVVCGVVMLADAEVVGEHFREAHRVGIDDLRERPTNYLKQKGRRGTNEDAEKDKESPPGSIISRPPCPFCEKWFHSLTGLRKHCAEAHNDRDPDSVEKARKSIREVECLQCHNVILNEYDLVSKHFKTPSHRIRMKAVAAEPWNYLRLATEDLSARKRKADANDAMPAKGARTSARSKINFLALKCPWCNMSFNNLKKMMVHATSEHSIAKPEENEMIKPFWRYTMCLSCDAIILKDYDTVAYHSLKRHKISATDLQSNIDKYFKDMPEGYQESNDRCSLICPYCQKIFDSFKKLSNHATSNHGIKNPDKDEKLAKLRIYAQCLICDKVIAKEGMTVHNHFYNQHQILGTTVKANIDAYLKVVPKPEEKRPFPWHEFKCPWCPTTNKWFEKLKHHAGEKHSRPATDEQLKSVYKKVGRLRCRLCKAKTRSAYPDVVKHFRNKHEEVDMAEVREDPEKYLQVIKLTKQDRKDNNIEWATFKCPWCSEDFNLFRKLWDHAMNKHNQKEHIELDEIKSKLTEIKDAVPVAGCKICGARIMLTYNVVLKHFCAMHSMGFSEVEQNPSKFLKLNPAKTKKNGIPSLESSSRQKKMENGDKSDGADKSEDGDSSTPHYVLRCPWCPYTTNYIHVLKAHVSSFHGRDEKDQKVSSLIESIGKIKCELCSRVLKGSYADLKKHFLRLMGESST